jgi:hypothetical protein
MSYINLLPKDLERMITRIMDFRHSLFLSEFYEYISGYYTYNVNIIPILDKIGLSYTIYYSQLPFGHTKKTIVYYTNQWVTKQNMLAKLILFVNEYITSLNFTDNPALTDEMQSLAVRSMPNRINMILQKHGYCERMKPVVVFATEVN